MNLYQLRYFVTLAKFQHYMKASEQLCITQPSLSHAISALENERGVKLFEKDGRNVILTKCGKNFLKDAEYKTDVQQPLNITRNGQTLFKFNVRPLSFDEIAQCRKKATTYMANPGGASLPLVEKEVSTADYMAWKIYTATVATDGKKFWDNSALKEGLKKAGHMVMTQNEIIKEVLTAGELEAVSDAIDNLSGGGVSVVDYAKN